MSSVDIDYDEVKHETKHAYLIRIGEGFDSINVWLPKSQTELDEKRKIATVPEWLAEEKNLDYGYSDGPDEGDKFSIY